MTRPIVNMLLSMMFLASAGTVSGTPHQDSDRSKEPGSVHTPETYTAEEAQKVSKVEPQTEELRAYALSMLRAVKSPLRS